MLRCERDHFARFFGRFFDRSGRDHRLVEQGGAREGARRTHTCLRKDLERSQKAIPGNLSDNSISSRARRRNLFTGLIMVFCRVHRRLSCFCGAVNGLTTNRQDLHRITNAFTTNLFVCDQSAPLILSLSLSLSLSVPFSLLPFVAFSLSPSVSLAIYLSPFAVTRVSICVHGL